MNSNSLAQIGLIGLAVMGANLARNIASREIKTLVYNRTAEKTEKFLEEFSGEFLEGATDLKAFVKKIERPRKIILMVKSGAPVGAVIEQLKPLLEEGDIIIDCGNSNFHDTNRRFSELAKDSLHFVGCGVSGGEKGALNGPSLMPGGSNEMWESLKPIFEAIAAKDFAGGPCVTHVGNGAAGHYVKMVHNGIEYGMMQIMAEGYQLLRDAYALNAAQISEIFAKFNEGKLKSYLFEIGHKVLAQKDEFEDGYLADYILDQAAQKGTGKWTSIDALDRGVPLSTITEAVFGRVVSSQKSLRVKLEKTYPKEKFENELALEDFIEQLGNAFYASIMMSYIQGFHLISVANEEENWNINMAEVARIWQGGCIIRAELLKDFTEAFKESEAHPLAIPSLAEKLKTALPHLRHVCSFALYEEIPAPAMASALAYFDGITKGRGSANFIQGLRDYFGAHTYKRTDKEGIFHTDWYN